MYLLFFIIVVPVLITVCLYGTQVWQRRMEEKRQRDFVKKSIANQRLNKLLQYLGVEIDAYVRYIPAQDILKHTMRCEGCEAVEVCDACLRDGKRIADMNFCPNYQALLVESLTLAKHPNH